MLFKEKSSDKNRVLCNPYSVILSLPAYVMILGSATSPKAGLRPKKVN